MLGTKSRETYCSHIVGQLSVRNGVGAVRLRASDHGVDNSFQRMGSMIGNGSICSMSRTPSPPQTQTGTDTHTHTYIHIMHSARHCTLLQEYRALDNGSIHSSSLQHYCGKHCKCTSRADTVDRLQRVYVHWALGRRPAKPQLKDCTICIAIVL